MTDYTSPPVDGENDDNDTEERELPPLPPEVLAPDSAESLSMPPIEVDTVVLGGFATDRRERGSKNAKNFLAKSFVSWLSQEIGSFMLGAKSYYEAADETEQDSIATQMVEEDKKRRQGVIAKLLGNASEANVARKRKRGLK